VRGLSVGLFVWLQRFDDLDPAVDLHVAPLVVRKAVALARDPQRPSRVVGAEVAVLAVSFGRRGLVANGTWRGA